MKFIPRQLVIAKYSSSYKRKLILHVFMVSFIVYSLHKRIRKRKFEPICCFIWFIRIFVDNIP